MITDPSTNPRILAEFVAYLRTRIDASVPMLFFDQYENRLSIQVGANCEAIVGVVVSDPSRPSFQISYPELTIKRDGTRFTKVTIFDGAMSGGVEWVVRQLAEHGVVTPEFMD